MPHTGTLRETELSDLRFVSKWLRTHDHAQFVPGELSEDEARVLIAGAQSHAQGMKYKGIAYVQSLETQFLHGGRSPARIAVIRVNREGRSVVAKIDKKDRILDEVGRFRAFVGEWDTQLQPNAFFHGSAAVILFGLVQDEQHPNEPAPVLEQRLDDLWNMELFPSSEGDPETTESNLTAGLENAAMRLCTLNKMSPPQTEFPPIGNPYFGFFDALEKRGLNWGFDDAARMARKDAEARFARLSLKGIVHGDVHLRNILVRGDRDAHFIDYAGSGPGHPAVDLVRLELAIACGCMQVLNGDGELAGIQRLLCSPERVIQYEAIHAAAPQLASSRVNRVCMAGVVAARNYAIEAVLAHGGDVQDYHAAKCLVAWQNLLMKGRQPPCVRSAIEAVTAAIV